MPNYELRIMKPNYEWNEGSALFNCPFSIFNLDFY